MATIQAPEMIYAVAAHRRTVDLELATGREAPGKRDLLRFERDTPLARLVVLRIVLDDGAARAHSVALPLLASSARQSRSEQRDQVRAIFTVATCSAASSTRTTVPPPESDPNSGALHGFGPCEPVSGTPDELDDIDVPVAVKRETFYEAWVERILSRSG